MRQKLTSCRCCHLADEVIAISAVVVVIIVAVAASGVFIFLFAQFEALTMRMF